MKFLWLLAVITASQSVLADGIYGREAERMLRKVGKGMVYRNDRPLLRAPRSCALLRQEFATESTERDVLVIGYAGAALRSNDAGVFPQGTYINKTVFWEAGVFYDVATRETRTSIPGGVKYEVCYGVSSTAFATQCTANNFLSRSSVEITAKKTVLRSVTRSRDGKTTTWMSDCQLP